MRTAVVWDGLEPFLAGPALDVLDIGGGTGVSAVTVAGRGHRVTVVDPSPDALASLARRAQEHGVDVAGVQGDVTTVGDVVPGGVDLVLCHGVLEVVDEPAAALAAIRGVLRVGGTLSLLVAQRHAAVVARAMAGHFAAARDLLPTGPGGGTGDGPGDGPTGGDGGASGGGRRFTDDEARLLLDGAGFQTTAVHGVRVFADLVPGSLLDLEPGAGASLVELERAVADLAEYRPLATQLHLLAR